MRKVKNLPFLIYICLVSVFYSCGSEKKGSNKLVPSSEEVENAKNGDDSNPILQQKPVLMVIPSDALLKRLESLTEVNTDGKKNYIRDYNKAFANSSELKFAITGVEQKFAEQGFPLDNLEQTLKQLGNEKAMDEMTNVEKDLRTKLLSTARPDMIIELDYEAKPNTSGRNYSLDISYNIAIIDAYTNKTVAAVQDIGSSKDDNITDILKEQVSINLPKLQEQIVKHFADLVANGKEITFRIVVEQGSALNFSDDCNNEEYTDWVREWLKKNAKNATFKSVISTDKELRFTNLRIPSHTKEGSPYSAYDFANDFRKEFGKDCKLKIKNQTQSIGDAFLMVKAE